MRIAVIGGSGFIGTRLVRRLAPQHEVWIVDKAASEAYPERVRIADVRELAALRSACEGAEVIVNLAAEHRDDVRPVSRYDEVNVGGARNVVAVAEDLGVEQLVFTSSVAVYGFPKDPLGEDAPPNPFNDYGRTKLEAEKVYRAWLAGKPGRSLRIVRPTVVFGEANRGNVYNLLHQLAVGPFLMVGNGRNRKSMAYVENVAACLEFTLSLPEGLHLFNYVDKPDLDMNELVREIRTTLGRPPKVGFRLPYWAGYAAGLVADGLAALLRRPLPLSRIRVQKFCASTQFLRDRVAEAGFRPPVELKAALERTILHEFGELGTQGSGADRS